MGSLEDVVRLSCLNAGKANRKGDLKAKAIIIPGNQINRRCHGCISGNDEIPIFSSHQTDRAHEASGIARGEELFWRMTLVAAAKRCWKTECNIKRAVIASNPSASSSGSDSFG